MKISLANSENYKWGADCDGWHLLKTSSLSVIQERMPSGTSECAHFHSKSQQLFYILSGVASFTMGDQMLVLTSGECVHIPSGQVHSISNEQSGTLEFSVISEPMAYGDRTDIHVDNEIG